MDEQEPLITSGTIARAIPIPAAGRVEQIARLGAILEVEPWGWSRRTGNDEGVWSYTVDRRVRRLRDVSDATDYWSRTRETNASTAPGPMPAGPNQDQASRVRAWIELHATPPRLVVVNASEAELRNVVPTPTLLTRGVDGEVRGYIGGAPCGRVAEISPGGAAIVELAHFAASALDPAVESTLHVEFDDSRGQRWQLGHGQIIPIESPHGPPVALGTGQLVAASALDLGQSAVALAAATERRVAFLSHVHEDTDAVDRLQIELEAEGIVVWRDLERLFPGDNINTVITRAIRDQSFAFVSCFSSARARRDSTIANRELATAVDVLQDHATSIWFIPVAFDNTPLPDVSLGPIHGHISDILRVNLFGPGRNAALVKLVAALTRLT